MTSAFRTELRAAHLERAAMFAGHAFAACDDDETSPVAPVQERRTRTLALTLGFVAFLIGVLAFS